MSYVHLLSTQMLWEADIIPEGQVELKEGRAALAVLICIYVVQNPRADCAGQAPSDILHQLK